MKRKIALSLSIPLLLASCQPVPTFSSATPSSEASSSVASSSSSLVQADAITISPSSLSLKVGEKGTFSYSLSPIGATNKVTAVYDDSIVSVDLEKGEVTALMIGSTKILLRTDNGKSASLSVTVTGSELPSFDTDLTRSVLGIGETLSVNLITDPEGISPKEFLFKSDDPSVASFSEEGVLKGVAIGQTSISISSKMDPSIKRSYSIEVTDDSNKILEDRLLSTISKASKNEMVTVSSGNLSITRESKNTGKKAFSNAFEVHDGYIYNDIEDYSGNKYMLYKGIYENRIYTVKYDESMKKLERDYSAIGDSVYSGEAKPEVAKKETSLAAFYPLAYSSKYSYGLGHYINETLLESFGEGKAISQKEDGSILLKEKKETFSGVLMLSLGVSFSADSFKSVSFESKSYKKADLDASLEPLEGKSPYESETIVASFVNDGHKEESAKRVDPANFFYSDFDLVFYSSDDRGNEKTSFKRGETIVYEPKTFAPSEADEFFDRIEAVSSSNPEVLAVSENKMALNALSEGNAEITFQSKKVTKKVTLSVTLPAVESITLSLGQTCIEKGASTSLNLRLSPFGSSYEDIDLRLGEGEEKYLSIEKGYYDGYYILKANSNIEGKEVTAHISATSKSNPSIKAEASLKIIEPLTNAEMLEVLTTGVYQGAAQRDYYGIRSELIFGSDNKGTFTLYRPNGSVFDRCSFQFTVSKGRISLVNNKNFENGYCESLTLSVNSPDLNSLSASFVDLTDEEEGEISVSYTMIRSDNNA